MSYNYFLRYKEVKYFFQIDFQGYSFDKIIAQDLITTVYWGGRISLKFFLFGFLKLNFNFLKETQPADIFSTMGRYNRRKDYYEILSYVTGKIRSIYTLDINNCKYNVCFSLSNILKAYKIVFSQKIPHLTSTEKLILFVRSIHYFNCIVELERFELETKFRKYLAFSSVHPYEAIFTLYFQKRLIPTFSLQHGLYFIFKQEVPIDALAYENFISDFHFCWGRYTKDEFTEYGISEDKLLIGGYPREVVFIEKNAPFVCRECIVFLARHKYAESNSRVINLLKEYQQKHREEGVKFYFKLHPTLNESVYEEMLLDTGLILKGNATLTELLQSDKYDFSLAVNTAAYYESYIFGVPCLRYSDDTFENSIGVREDLFSSCCELESRIQELKSIENLHRYNLEVMQKLDYIIGLNTSNYENIFERLNRV